MLSFFFDQEMVFNVESVETKKHQIIIPRTVTVTSTEIKYDHRYCNIMGKGGNKMTVSYLEPRIVYKEKQVANGDDIKVTLNYCSIKDSGKEIQFYDNSGNLVSSFQKLIGSNVIFYQRFGITYGYVVSGSKEKQYLTEDILAKLCFISPLLGVVGGFVCLYLFS